MVFSMAGISIVAGLGVALRTAGVVVNNFGGALASAHAPLRSRFGKTARNAPQRHHANRTATARERRNGDMDAELGAREGFHQLRLFVLDNSSQDVGDGF